MPLLLRLLAGGNNCQCLLRVWEELHDGIRVWLYTQGRGPAPFGSPHQAVLAHAPSFTSPPAHHGFAGQALPNGGALTGLGMGKGSGGSLLLPPTSGGAPYTPSGGSAGVGGTGSGPRDAPGGAVGRVFDKGACSLALMAVRAIQQGVAATDMYLALGQVRCACGWAANALSVLRKRSGFRSRARAQLAVDRVMALGREASANLKALLVAAEEVRGKASPRSLTTRPPQRAVLAPQAHESRSAVLLPRCHWRPLSRRWPAPATCRRCWACRLASWTS